MLFAITTKEYILDLDAVYFRVRRVSRSALALPACLPGRLGDLALMTSSRAVVRFDKLRFDNLESSEDLSSAVQYLNLNIRGNAVRRGVAALDAVVKCSRGARADIDVCFRDAAFHKIKEMIQVQNRPFGVGTRR